MNKKVTTMKTYTYYKPLKPNTVTGYSVKLTTIYSSFNESEINSLIEEFKKTIGSGLVSYYDRGENNGQ